MDGLQLLHMQSHDACPISEMCNKVNGQDVNCDSSDVSASLDEEDDSESGSDDHCGPVRKVGSRRGVTKSSRKRRKRPEWTRNEEETLAKVHCGVGNQWSAIAARLPGRTANEVKNIWHSTLRSKQLKVRSLLRAYASALHGRWDDSEARQDAYNTALKLNSAETEAAEANGSAEVPGTAEGTRRTNCKSATAPAAPAGTVKPTSVSQQQQQEPPFADPGSVQSGGSTVAAKDVAALPPVPSLPPAYPQRHPRCKQHYTQKQTQPSISAVATAAAVGPNQSRLVTTAWPPKSAGTAGVSAGCLSVSPTDQEGGMDVSPVPPSTNVAVPVDVVAAVAVPYTAEAIRLDPASASAGSAQKGTGVVTPTAPASAAAFAPATGQQHLQRPQPNVVVGLFGGPYIADASWEAGVGGGGASTIPTRPPHMVSPSSCQHNSFPSRGLKRLLPPMPQQQGQQGQTRPYPFPDLKRIKTELADPSPAGFPDSAPVPDASAFTTAAAIASTEQLTPQHYYHQSHGYQGHQPLESLEQQQHPPQQQEGEHLHQEQQQDQLEMLCLDSADNWLARMDASVMMFLQEEDEEEQSKGPEKEGSDDGMGLVKMEVADGEQLLPAALAPPQANAVVSEPLAAAGRCVADSNSSSLDKVDCGGGGGSGGDLFPCDGVKGAPLAVATRVNGIARQGYHLQHGQYQSYQQQQSAAHYAAVTPRDANLLEPTAMLGSGPMTGAWSCNAGVHKNHPGHRHHPSPQPPNSEPPGRSSCWDLSPPPATATAPAAAASAYVDGPSPQHPNGSFMQGTATASAHETAGGFLPGNAITPTAPAAMAAASAMAQREAGRDASGGSGDLSQQQWQQQEPRPRAVHAGALAVGGRMMVPVSPMPPPPSSVPAPPVQQATAAPTRAMYFYPYHQAYPYPPHLSPPPHFATQQYQKQQQRLQQQQRYQRRYQQHPSHQSPQWGYQQFVQSQQPQQQEVQRQQTMRPPDVGDQQQPQHPQQRPQQLPAQQAQSCQQQHKTGSGAVSLAALTDVVTMGLGALHDPLLLWCASDLLC